MQAYIEKHLLGMTSLLPPCAGFIKLCHKCHVFGISCHAKRTVQQDCMNISSPCWQTLCYQDATLGGWKAFFFPSHSCGDKGQNKIFENSPSVSPAPSFLNFMVQLSCQNLFSSKFDSSFLSMGSIPLTAATVTQLQGPGKFDQPK